jgi:hypothetical protein
VKRQKSTWIAIVLLAALTAGCSAYGGANPSVNLEGIEAPGNEKMAFALSAVGTQIYSCQPKDGHSEWAATPEADLYNDKGEKVGRHKGGPSWETLDGGRRVVGDKAQAKAKSAGGADAIDWLRLPAKSNTGSGMFSQVKTIQRINTVGGKGPKGACDPAKDSAPVPVYYGATYYFYVAKE